MQSFNSAEKAEVQRLLSSSLKLESLRTLAFNLGAPYYVYELDSTQETAKALVEYLDKRNLLRCLEKVFFDTRLKPEVSWWFQRLPPCTPPTKVEILLQTTYAGRLNVEKLVEELVTVLHVAREQFILVALLAGSTETLFSIPSTIQIDFASFVYRPELISPTPNVSRAPFSVIRMQQYDTLPRINREVWRYAAIHHPPLRDGNDLQASTDWKKASASVTPDPSSLIAIDREPSAGLREASRWAQTLLHEMKQISSAPRGGQWYRTVEEIYYDAARLKREDQFGYALVLLQLADLARTASKLGPALKYGMEAEQVLANWPENQDYYNHAVAFYSLGLISHELGSEDEAFAYFERAIDAFRHARDGCYRRGDIRHAEQCNKMSALLEFLLVGK